MFYKLKLLFFHTSKILGLFWLSRIIFKKHLRILCYHGFSMIDEDAFVPGLFIKPSIFAKRMQYLADKKYNIIPLQTAYDLKQAKNFSDDSIVITIDDGFWSVLKESLPIFKKHMFPSTLYLTSYYFNRDCPIYTLAVEYMFFKTTTTNTSLEQLKIPRVHSQNDYNVSQKIKDFGKSLETEDQRTKILQKLGKLLEVDYDSLNKSRILNLITAEELSELENGGIDIQLHTHRHDLPEEYDVADYEIEKNKSEINQFSPEFKTHFCYPSGIWSETHWSVLEKHKILTATTCEPKLVNYNTPNYSLNRILDSARVSQIEFEAEVSGFNELIRMIRRK